MVETAAPAKPRGGFRPGSGRKAIGRFRGFRASDEQYEAWRRAADRAGIKLAEWIRHVLDEAAQAD